MTIDRVTAAEFLTKLRAALLSRTNAYDTAYGPVLDLILNPLSVVLEDQNNNRLRRVSALMSLENSTEFTEDDLDARVFDESLVRPDGSFAVTTVTFRSPSPPSIDTTIQLGYPIGTSPDESTGESVTFVTTEAKTLPSATASSYFNPVSNRYELTVPVQALTAGAAGRVGAGRINRPLRPLVLFQEVTNTAAVETGGRDRFTNDELIELFLLAVVGRQLSTPAGIEFFTRDVFTAVEDAHEIFGTDPLLTRGDSDAGAVDCFIKGSELVSYSDSLTYLGKGQLIPVLSPPLVAVTSVTINAVAATEGIDYEVVFDESGVSGSTRAVEGIRVLPAPGTSGVNTAPAGSAAVIGYTANQLIRDLQASTEDEDTAVNGRDLLYREAEQVDIVVNAQLKTRTGFNPATTASLVTNSLLAFVDALGIGDDVEGSDLQGEVRKITAVDNFIITRLTRSTAATGTSDVAISGNEFPDLAAANVVLTFI